MSSSDSSSGSGAGDTPTPSVVEYVDLNLTSVQSNVVLTKTDTDILVSVKASPDIISDTDREVIGVAVLDKSGSMQGDAIRYAKQGINYVLDNMSGKFAIIPYATNVEVQRRDSSGSGFKFESIGDASSPKCPNVDFCNFARRSRLS